MAVLRMILMAGGLGVAVISILLVVARVWRARIELGRALLEGEPAIDAKIRRPVLAAAVALICALAGKAVIVVPPHHAGVVSNELSGSTRRTIGPGAHLTLPLLDSARIFDLREQTWSAPEYDTDPLKAHSKEGLATNFGITVTFRHPSEGLGNFVEQWPEEFREELLKPTALTIFRLTVSEYPMEAILSDSRPEIERAFLARLRERLDQDGFEISDAFITNVSVPGEYQERIDKLIFERQEVARMESVLERKAMEVKERELDAEAEFRERKKRADAAEYEAVKTAEGQAKQRVVTAEARAKEIDKLLPFKEKEIKQIELEAKAKRVATVQEAEGEAEKLTIQTQAESRRRLSLAQSEVEALRIESDSQNVRVVEAAEAFSEARKIEAEAKAADLKMEGEALKGNALVVHKAIADRLSDNIQLVIVPNDAPFFTNEIMKGMAAGTLGNENAPAE